MRSREELIAVEKRKRAFLGCDLNRSDVGCVVDLVQPFVDKGNALRRTVTRTAEDECIGKPGHAEADAPLRHGFGALLVQWETRDVDDVVEKADRRARQCREFAQIDVRAILETLAHELRKIDRAEQAGAVRWQWLLS